MFSQAGRLTSVIRAFVLVSLSLTASAQNALPPPELGPVQSPASNLPQAQVDSVVLPDLMSLAQVLSLANERHPEVLKHEAQAQLSQAEALGAGFDSRWKADLLINARTADLVNLDRGFQNDSWAQIGLSKVLWDFGRTGARRDVAQLGVESTDVALDYARRLQRIQIMKRFFEVLAADYQFAADNEAMTLAFFPYNRAEERRERFDSVSELEVMEKRAVYFDEFARRNQSIRQQRASRLRLALAMGLPKSQPDSLIQPDLSAYERELPDFDELLEKVMHLNPVLKQKKVELAQLKANTAVVDSAGRPSLSMKLEAADYVQDYRFRDRARATLSLDVPLLAGSVQDAEQAKLAAKLASKEAELLSLDYQVREQVLGWAQRLEMLTQQIGQNELNLEYRERALDKSRIEYENEVRAQIGRAQADMAKLIWLSAQAEFERALIWEQLDAVLGLPEVEFN